MIDEGEVVFNGLEGPTGSYLVDAAPDPLADLAKVAAIKPEHLEHVLARLARAEATLAPVRTVSDPSDLAQTGWGVIFADDGDPAVYRALKPLLDLRCAQAGRDKRHYYREYVGPNGYHRGESATRFLRDRGARPSGSADPETMPYYLLIVGDPARIPYDFQYQMDVQYAVGRIYFPNVDDYESYARSVAQAELGPPGARRAVFVGVANDDDRATDLSCRYLVEPLAADAFEWQAKAPRGQAWTVETVLRADATKQRLRTLLGGADTPSLLFTASHGVGFRQEHPLQLEHQGALVCQDWPGPRQWRGDPIRDFYLAGEDVGDDARLGGLIAFFFACYGVGTPSHDDLPQLVDGRIEPTGPLGTSPSLPIALRSFAARLPQRLLAHPKGGALAVVGHVERALGSSFFEPGAADQRRSPPIYRGAMSLLLRGARLGAAIEPFNERYAELASTFEGELRQILAFRKQTPAIDLARMWIATTDARGFAIFGDPAVRVTACAAPLPDGGPARQEQPTSSAGSQPRSPPGEPSTASTFETGAASPPGDASVSRGRSRPETPVGRVQIEVDATTGRVTLTTVPGDGGAGGPASPGGAASGAADALLYGWPFSSGGSEPSALDGVRDKIGSILSDAASRLGKSVSDLVGDLAVLEVATYTSANPDGVSYDDGLGRFVGPASRRILTRIRFDGDSLLLLPEEAEDVDDQLWQRHADLVGRAQTHRAELIKAVAEAIGGLMGLVKPA